MKLICLLIALTASVSLAQAGTVAANPELAEVKTVYLLPMSYSLDQFLAIRLTKGGVVQVVTDPNKADAILSDHIGASLEDKLKSMYGEQKAAEVVDPAAKDKDAKDKDKASQSTFAAGPMAGGSRSKGAIFLVDRKTRNVVWSDYVRPKNAQPDELHHVADRIANQLEKDKKGK
jgi:hypothetical protein